MLCLAVTYGQSKKEQISKLTFMRDSLNSALTMERNSANIKSAEFLATILQQKIEIERQKNEIEWLKTLPTSEYLITDNASGMFTIGGPWQSLAKNDYHYKSVQGYGTCVDACCDGGFVLGKTMINTEFGYEIERPDVTIGALGFSTSVSKTQFKTNPNVFYISSDNCSGWYWKDKISYLVVYSEAFKTKEGVGVGTTLEKLQELLGKVVISISWIEEDINAIQLKVSAYPNIDFILDSEDAVGDFVKQNSLGEQKATVSDFKKDAKIKRIIIRSNTK